MSELILSETEHEAILTDLIPMLAKLARLKDPRRREQQILSIYQQYDRRRAFKEPGELLDRALLRKDHLPPSASPSASASKQSPKRVAKKRRRKAPPR